MNNLSTNTVYLEAIRLINCQSWKDVTISLSKGLNAIIAENNTGKSVLFKLLKTTACPNFYDSEERSKLVRWKEECAQIYYLFSDDSCGVVKVFPNKVIYGYTEKFSTQAFYTQQDVPIPEILDKLALIVDSNEEFIANILDLDQSLLLVDSNTKANYNLIKLLTEHKDLKRLIPLFNNKKDIYSEKYQETANIVQRLEKKLSNISYVDIDGLSSEIESSEAILRVLNTLLRTYSLEDSLVNLDIDMLDFDFLIDISTMGGYIEEFLLVDFNILFNEIDYSFIPSIDFGVSLESELNDINGVDLDNLYSYDENSIKICEIAITLEAEISAIDVVPVDISDVDIRLSSINILESFVSVDALFSSAIEQSSKLKFLESDMIYIEEKLNVDGLEVNCPIYGSVIYSNGKCIPCDK